MHRKRFNLPPLDLIQGFEAAARNLSFTKAADELLITQSAVSRQIRALEEHLGVSLFERRPRTLALTEHGRTLQRAATELLERLQQVTDGLKAERSAPQLTVTTTNGFASLWLIPRLRGFTTRHPTVDVRISATYEMLNLERSLVDVAVRYCRDDKVPPGAVRLFGEDLLPVCSPTLLQTPGRPLRGIEDLRHHTLLYMDEIGAVGTWLEWGTWLAAHGHPDLKPAAALHFGTYEQVIGAAVSGQGVGMGIGKLVGHLLHSGQLVAPLGEATAGQHGYYIVRSSATGARPQVQAFVDWLIEEAKSVVPDPDAAKASGGKVSSRSRAGR
jgi:LysR family transcriptional regulator, glycine cleavage system transcriptional activator